MNKDDLDEWQEYIKGVKPLPQPPKAPVKPIKKVVTQFTLTPAPPPKPMVPQPSRKIKNLHVQAHLDLHGLTQEQAYRRLIHFIDQSARAQHRCVLVITGKGKSSGDEWWKEQGILKTMVPRWLQEEPLRSKLSTTAPAKPEHGGSGALYVFLKAKA